MKKQSQFSIRAIHWNQTHQHRGTIFDNKMNVAYIQLIQIKNIYRIFDEYENFFKKAPSQSSLVVIDDNFTDYILKLATKYQLRINSQYLAAISFDSVNGTESIIAWFNNQPFHTAPLTLNLVHNAIVRAFLGNDHSIRVINKPIPFTINSRINFLEAGNSLGFQLASNVGFAMAFVAAFYVMFYIKVSFCCYFII